MAKERIQVYTDGTDLKNRVAKLRGNYSESLFCYNAIEKEVKRLEKLQTNKHVEG